MYSQTSAWFVVLFCMLLFMFSCFDTVAIFVLTLSLFGFVVLFVCHVFCYFYRAMHFSAKRGIAIACRLSVCPSVCDVGEL